MKIIVKPIKNLAQGYYFECWWDCETKCNGNTCKSLFGNLNWF